VTLAPATRHVEDVQATGLPGRPWARVLWLGPALLTLVLGCYHLGRPELWRDELWSWKFAAEPVHALLAGVSAFNPALVTYELLLHYWIAAFGDSAPAMRLLSVLAMAAAAAVVTLLGYRLAGTRAGLFAGLIFAVVPSVSRFAQETRYYAPQVLAVAVASLLLLRALDRPVLPRWAVYAASLAVVGYLDLVAFAVLAGHAAWVGLRWHQQRDGRLGWFVPATAAGIAACLPILTGAVSTAGNQVGWIARPGVSVAEVTGFGWNLFYSAPVAAAVLVLGLFAWAARREAAVAASLAVLPVLTVWLVSQGADSYFLPRYLLYTLIGWTLLAGIGLSRIRWPQAVACILAIALLGAGDQQMIRQTGAHDWASYPAGASGDYYLDYAGVASLIADQASPGDGLWYPMNNWQMIGPGIRYYLPPTLRGRFISVTRPQPRIWVVTSGRPANPYRQMNKGYVAALQHYTLAGTWHRRGLTLFLITRRAGRIRTGDLLHPKLVKASSLAGPQ
jgi:mannosyltransferase